MVAMVNRHDNNTCINPLVEIPVRIASYCQQYDSIHTVNSMNHNQLGKSVCGLCAVVSVVSFQF